MRPGSICTHFIRLLFNHCHITHANMHCSLGQGHGREHELRLRPYISLVSESWLHREPKTSRVSCLDGFSQSELGNGCGIGVHSVKTYQSVHLKSMQLTACPSHLNTAVTGDLLLRGCGPGKMGVQHLPLFPLTRGILF